MIPNMGPETINPTQDEPNFDGPIPGENYTSDTRNYPWHRAPDLVDHDEAVEYVVSQLSEPRAFSTAMTMLEAGASLSGVVSTINMLNISNGKYPIDVSLLIAGPIARYLQLVAKQNGITADIGNEGEDEYMTVARMKAMAGIIEEESGQDTVTEAEISPNEGPSGGLMAPPTSDGVLPADTASQSAMLGYGDEEGFM